MNLTDWHLLCRRFGDAWRDHADSQVLGSILREQADWIAENVPAHVSGDVE